jgi:Pyridoxamine 5'-phosphate oxidase
MAKFYGALDDELRAFISAQRVFFVGTAPDAGRINLSPKGMNTFRCLDDRTVAYLDLTGSGNETAAHLRQNGRLTIMFCSFDERPLILRLYGRGQVVRPNMPQWQHLRRHFPVLRGERQIVLVELQSMQTSCGFGVPLYEFHGERQTLDAWAAKKGPAGIATYWQDKNRLSIDGLPTGISED